MKTIKFLLAATAVAVVLISGLFNTAPIQAQTSTGGGSHQGQIWGKVRTHNMATSRFSRLEKVTIVVRDITDGRPGGIVGISKINHGQYAVDMDALPAGKYVVMVDPGGSFYMTGERLVNWPGPGGSVEQDWTVSTEQMAVPSLE
jgi:hypothetical protein